MRTPDEIKKGLECHINPSCDRCPYEAILDCRGKNADALEYIRQLEDHTMRRYTASVGIGKLAGRSSGDRAFVRQGIKTV